MFLHASKPPLEYKSTSLSQISYSRSSSKIYWGHHLIMTFSPTGLLVFFWKRFPQVLTLLASFELLLSLFQIPWSPLFLAMKTITTDKTSGGSWATSVMYSLITSKGETNDCKFRNLIIVEQKETEFTFVSESGPFWRTMFYQVFCLR